MILTRRDVGKIALAGLPASRLFAAEKPNSVFGGVLIGTITYSFRGINTAEDTLKAVLDCGISGIELMNGPAENYAGAPAGMGRGGMFGAPGGAGARGAGAPGGAAPGAPPAAPGGAPGGAPGQGQAGRGRGAMTPEQQEAQRKAAEEMRNWRLSVSMDKYKALRKMYNDAGVNIYAFKLEPRMDMTDDEFAYIWNVAETLGADHVTMELPTDDALLKRVADYAAKRRFRIAFHTHGQGGSSGFDRALSASPYTALNFDVGHFFGVNGTSPVPLVEQYASRIASLHLKDRAAPPPADPNNPGAQGRGGANLLWGQGGTPIREVLQLMKARQYKFPASVEFEYSVPEGSNVVAEVRRCVEFCRQALA